MSKVFSYDNNEYELTMYNKFINYADDEMVGKIFNFIDNYPKDIDKISSVIKRYSNEIAKHEKLTEDVAINLIKHRYIDFIIDDCYWDGCLTDICRKFSNNINIISLLVDYLPENAINIIISTVKFNRDIADYFIDNDLFKEREYVVRNIIYNSRIYTPDELIEAIDYYRSKGFSMESHNRWNKPLVSYIRNTENLSLKVIKYICKHANCKITKKIILDILSSNVTNKSEILKILCKKLKKSNKFIFSMINKNIKLASYRNIYEFDLGNIKLIIDMLCEDINCKNDNNMNLLEYYINIVDEVNKNDRIIVELSEDFVKYLTDKGLTNNLSMEQ